MTHRAKLAWLTNLFVPTTHLLSYYCYSSLAALVPLGNSFLFAQRTQINYNPFITHLKHRKLHSFQKQTQHPFLVTSFSTRRTMSSDSNTNVSVDDGLFNIGGEEKDTSKNKSEASKPLTTWKTKIDKSNKTSRHIRGSNYIQLATSIDNEPRCRTVVFRGFQNMPHKDIKGDTSKCFKMITDKRSQKVKQSNVCEIVWWFFQTKEQYRIRGTIQYIGSDDANINVEYQKVRRQQWGNLTDAAREQFYWNDPSKTYALTENIPKGGRDEDGNIVPPPDNFLIMLAYPYHVDYLNLKSNFRQVDTLEDDNETWNCSRMNP